MYKQNLDKKSLRKFGITLGMAFLVISLLIFLRHRHSVLPTFMIAAIFLTLSLTMPVFLKPVYIFWMKLAFVLCWVNTRLILIIIFYFIFAPIGIVMKVLGIDLLDRKIEKNKESYWIRKEKQPFNAVNYERQF